MLNIHADNVLKIQSREKKKKINQTKFYHSLSRYIAVLHARK